jgi:hypothetical protein
MGREAVLATGVSSRAPARAKKWARMGRRQNCERRARLTVVAEAQPPPKSSEGGEFGGFATRVAILCARRTDAASSLRGHSRIASRVVAPGMAVA